MQDRNSLIRAFFETLIITFIYLSIGYLFFPNDPLILDAKIPVIPILLTIITLYHGAKFGLLSLLIICAVLSLFYQSFDLYPILSNLILLLILGQFYHYWNKKFEKLEAINDYTKNRLDEMQHSFYTLKISHDILKNSYVLKPKSIRSSFKKISKMSKVDNLAFEQFFNIIYEAYNIQEAIIAGYKNGKWTTISKRGEDQNREFDIKDPLVQETLENSQTSYISTLSEKESKYLSVIPFKDEQDNIKAILAIEKMPFLNFNQDTVISISILFTHFLHQLRIIEYLNTKGDTSLTSSQKFTYNFEKLLELYNRFNIDSSIIIFKCNDKLSLYKLKDKLEKSLRSIDQFKILKEYPYNVILLLPLTTTDGAKSMQEKIKPLLDKNSIESMAFSINEKSLMLKYIKEN